MNRIKYVVDGSEVQHLQVILRPDEKVYFLVESFCWSSENIITNHSYLGIISIFSSFLSSDTTLGTASNSGTSDGFIGVGNSTFGRIFEYKILPDSPKIVCISSNFLVASFSLSVKLGLVIPIGPLASIPLRYFEISPNNSPGSLFMQSCSQIMVRELNNEETIIMKLSCLVAFERTCTIQLASNDRNFLSIFRGTIFSVRVQGPGKVFFCANSKTKFLQTNGGVAGELLMILAKLFVVFFITTFVTVVIITVLSFDIRQLRPEDVHL